MAAVAATAMVAAMVVMGVLVMTAALVLFSAAACSGGGEGSFVAWPVTHLGKRRMLRRPGHDLAFVVLAVEFRISLRGG